MKLAKKQTLWVFFGFLFIYQGIQIIIPTVYGFFYGLKLMTGGEEVDIFLLEEEMIARMLEISPISMFISAVVILFIYYIVLKRHLISSFFDFIKTKSLVLLGVFGFAGILVVNVVVNIIYTWLGIEGNSINQDYVGDMVTNSPWLMLIAVAFLVPIIEELFFRKVLIDFFSRWGDVLAVVVSSVLFALPHVMQGDFVFLPVYSLMGAGLGYIYVKGNRNIFVTIAAHILNNLFSVLIMLLL